MLGRLKGGERGILDLHFIEKKHELGIKKGEEELFLFYFKRAGVLFGAKKYNKKDSDCATPNGSFFCAHSNSLY